MFLLLIIEIINVDNFSVPLVSYITVLLLQIFFMVLILDKTMNTNWNIFLHFILFQLIFIYFR